MKRLALSLAIIGIFILLILLNFQAPISINKPLDMDLLEQNQKVKTMGHVISERVYPEIRILKLDNEIEITCEDCKTNINKTLIVTGVIERYQNRTRIKALRIDSIKEKI